MAWPLSVLAVLSGPHSWAPSTLSAHVPALWSRLGLFGMASADFQPPPWEPVWLPGGRLGRTSGEPQPLAHPVAVAGGMACVLGLGGWSSGKVPSFLHPLPIAEPVPPTRVCCGVWRDGRGSRGGCHPPLPLLTVHAGLGRASRRRSLALVTATVSGRQNACSVFSRPVFRPAAPTRLAAGTWLQEEVLVPICVSGDFGALPPKAPRRVPPRDT